jgi:hypothetical protein
MLFFGVAEINLSFSLYVVVYALFPRCTLHTCWSADYCIVWFKRSVNVTYFLLERWINFHMWSPPEPFFCWILVTNMLFDIMEASTRLFICYLYTMSTMIGYHVFWLGMIGSHIRTSLWNFFCCPIFLNLIRKTLLERMQLVITLAKPFQLNFPI